VLKDRLPFWEGPCERIQAIRRVPLLAAADEQQLRETFRDEGPRVRERRADHP
jgi:hypothetical protein